MFPMLGRCSPPPTAPPTAPAPDWTIPLVKQWEQEATNQANLGSIHNSPSNGLHAVHGKVSDLCNSQFQSLRHTANSAWFSLKERLTLPTPSTTELPAFLTPSKMLVNKPFGSSFAGSCAIWNSPKVRWTLCDCFSQAAEWHRRVRRASPQQQAHHLLLTHKNRFFIVLCCSRGERRCLSSVFC